MNYRIKFVRVLMNTWLFLVFYSRGWNDYIKTRNCNYFHNQSANAMTVLQMWISIDVPTGVSTNNDFLIILTLLPGNTQSCVGSRLEALGWRGRDLISPKLDLYLTLGLPSRPNERNSIKFDEKWRFDR